MKILTKHILKLRARCFNYVVVKKNGLIHNVAL